MKGLAFSTLSLLCSRTDEDAMWRVKTHDDHLEFSRLVKRWEEPIRRLCTRMTGDPHRGEDLRQETFLRLFERRKDYQVTGRFSTYLWRIALNLCYDELRRQERRSEFVRDPEPGDEASEAPDCAADGPGPDARAAQHEEGELVRQALGRLPEIYRTVLVLRHYEDMKLAKIAEILEIPEGTVNSRMAEALTRLSRILEPKLAPRPETRSRKAEVESQRPEAQRPEPEVGREQTMMLGKERFI
jgi:RNA polymerase sigma-70 factor, ECF subfamily